MTDWTNIRCQSCILYFLLLLLMVIWNRLTNVAMQSAKNRKSRSTKRQNRTKFITYNTFIGQPISNKMVEEAWKRHLSISKWIDWSVYYEWLKCHFLICLCDLMCCGSGFTESGSGSRSNPDPGFWWSKTKEKNTAENFSYIFLIKNCNLLIPRPLEKPSALKREQPALQKMKLITISILMGHFRPPGSGSGSQIRIRGLHWIRIGIHLQHWWIVDGMGSSASTPCNLMCWRVTGTVLPRL
jgi:hypothetical protein